MEKTKLNVIYAELRNSVELLGYDCVGFELTQESGMNILRVYVDMPGGVDLNDCEKVARAVNDYLDTVENVLPEKYYLEVSSPGLERPLFVPDDYRRFIGQKVYVSLGSGKHAEGAIDSVDDDGTLRLSCRSGKRAIAWSDIKRGKLVYVEETGQKKTFKKTSRKK